MPRSLTGKEAKRLLSGDVSEAYCNLDQMFDNINVLPSESGSSTAQVIANVRPDKAEKLIELYLERMKKLGREPKIFIKFMPANVEDNRDNRPNIEPAVYKYLYEKLVVPKVTPHIMNYVASAYCPSVADNLEWLNKSGKLENMVEHWYSRWYQGEPYDEDTAMQIMGLNDAKVMFIEFGKGSSLMSMLQEQTLDLSELRNISFQIGYTLRQMSKIGVRQNDLHAGNVWIEELPEKKKTLYYITRSKPVIIESKYMVRIYDFDLAAFTAKSLDSALVNSYIEPDMCQSYGICSTPNSMFDWYTVHWYMWKISHIERKFLPAYENAPFASKRIVRNSQDPYYEPLRDYIKSVTPDLSIYSEEYYTYQGRFCEKTENDTCKDPSKFPTNKLKTFIGLAHSKYYGKTKQTLDEIEEVDPDNVFRSL